jgi:hypothetical protein
MKVVFGNADVFALPKTYLKVGGKSVLSVCGIER